MAPQPPNEPSGHSPGPEPDDPNATLPGEHLIDTVVVPGPPSQSEMWRRLRNIPSIDDEPADTSVVGRGAAARALVADDELLEFDQTAVDPAANDPTMVLARDRTTVWPGAPVEPATPPAEIEPSPRPKRRRGRRLLRWVALVTFVALLASAGYGYFLWRSIDRVALGDVLSTTGSGQNFLIVGTDSRAGVSGDVANAGAIFGAGDGGARTDTIVVLRVTDDGARMVSIPRDLWIASPPSGPPQRINAALAQGPGVLVQTVQSLGIPVHHYIELDLAGFLDVVDALGGIVIDFPNPAFDRRSGLDIPTAGPVELDADQALAYVRSRAYTEVIDGAFRVDPTGDLGRIQRQQTFLNAVFAEAGATRNPITGLLAARAVSGGLRIDDQLGLRRALGVVRRLAGATPETVSLPVTPFTTSGGAEVLSLNPEAEGLLATFRS